MLSNNGLLKPPILTRSCLLCYRCTERVTMPKALTSLSTTIPLSACTPMDAKVPSRRVTTPPGWMVSAISLPRQTVSSLGVTPPPVRTQYWRWGNLGRLCSCETSMVTIIGGFPSLSTAGLLCTEDLMGNMLERCKGRKEAVITNK